MNEKFQEKISTKKLAFERTPWIKNKKIMKTFYVPKPKKSWGHFPKFQTAVYFKIK